MLTDDFDREVTGVRISLTDRCNFDCVYCHNEGLGDTRGPMEPQDDEIGTDDVVRFLEVVADYGVDAAKITGGEPLLRKDVEEIVRRAPDEIEISLTTNGTMLPGRAQDLADAGLDRVNISLDAMDSEEFEAVTQTGSFKAVLDGVDAALDALLDPVKLNMVVFEATAPQVPKMVDYVAEKDGMQLQLIEYMPELTGHADWTVDMDRVHGWLEEQADQIEQREMHGRKRYFVDGGMVEIVDPVGNADFCANCHRVRVTHDGKLKGCLNRNDDLRSMGEMTTDEIRQTFEETVANRVPYYGEYMVKNDQGEWVVNDAYCEQPASAD